MPKSIKTTKIEPRIKRVFLKFIGFRRFHLFKAANRKLKHTQNEIYNIHTFTLHICIYSIQYTQCSKGLFHFQNGLTFTDATSRSLLNGTIKKETNANSNGMFAFFMIFSQTEHILYYFSTHV